MKSCLRGLLARGFAPKHIVDVGAAHGAWTTTALSFWPSARYTLFEPLAEHAVTLGKLRNAHPNITWFPCALGREKTTLPISIYPDRLDSASLMYAGPGAREVAVERLDDLLASAKIGPADLLKIDVQGFEQEVILGANNLIKHVGVLITETYFFRFAPKMKLFHETVALMNNLGFRVYEVIDPMARPRDQAIGQCDICFVREGHPLLSSESWE